MINSDHVLCAEYAPSIGAPGYNSLEGIVKTWARRTQKQFSARRYTQNRRPSIPEAGSKAFSEKSPRKLT